MNTKSNIPREPQGTLTNDAGLSTDPVPLTPYHSQEFFERERDRLFRRAWLLMARVEELPEPGNFVLKNVYNCDTSILITHGKSGRIQAFHNTCSHRGSQVVTEPQGKRSRFTCPYHNWTYSNDGQLLALPDENNFFFEKSTCGLTPVATDTWEGWVFINLDPKPEVTLESYLGPLKEHLAGLKYMGADNPVIFSVPLDCNWKVALDAFIETYHIPALHPKTIATTFSSSVNPYARLLDAKILGTHQTVSMFGNSQYELDSRNKVEALAAGGGERGSVISAANKEAAAEYLSHPAINPTNAANWSMDATHIFPHVHLDTGPGGFWVHHFWPVTANTAIYEGRFYMDKAKNMRERFVQEIYLSRVAEVLLEDLVNVGRTQRGISNGGKEFMHLQDSEIAIRRSTQQVIKWVETDKVEEALS